MGRCYVFPSIITRCISLFPDTFAVNFIILSKFIKITISPVLIAVHYVNKCSRYLVFADHRFFHLAEIYIRVSSTFIYLADIYMAVERVNCSSFLFLIAISYCVEIKDYLIIFQTPIYFTRNDRIDIFVRLAETFRFTPIHCIEHNYQNMIWLK